MELDRFLTRAAGDFALLALLGGAIAWAWFGEAIGFGFAAGSLWMGLNVVLLGLVVTVFSPSRKGFSGLFKYVVACVKIPAAYLLLFWLFTRAYLDPMGLVAGLAALPVVLVLRGLIEAKSSRGAATEEQA